MHGNALVALALLAGGAPHAHAKLLNNPGFENGLLGWSASGNAAIRQNDPAPFEGLNYLFGQNTPQFLVWQDVGIAAAGVSAAGVDAGLVDAAFGGWQAGWNTQTDQGRISVRFLDAGLAEIGHAALPFFFSNRTWTAQDGSADVVPGTRTLRFRFEGVRFQGSNNDAFLDAAYLTVTAVPAPPAWLLLTPAGLFLLHRGQRGRP